MPEFPYDPNLDITAGELRERGIKVPENIPDEACIRRTALRYSVTAVDTKPDSSESTIHTIVEFLEPFRWINVAFSVSVEG